MKLKLRRKTLAPAVGPFCKELLESITSYGDSFFSSLHHIFKNPLSLGSKAVSIRYYRTSTNAADQIRTLELSVLGREWYS